jgi:multidrug efflux system outer membrane protein
MRSLALCLIILILNACTLGPDYHRPSMPVPPGYKEGSPPWKAADPHASAAPKGDWWKSFGDKGLDDLQSEAVRNNPQAQAAYARLEQATAIADVSRSAFFPTLSLNANDDRSQLSPNRALAPPAIPTRFTSSNYNLFLALDYDLDIWGRARRLFESARAQEEAQRALYENTLLLLQSNVAQQYYTIRAYDAELNTLRSAVKLRTNELDLVNRRFTGKIASALDVAQAQTLLYATQSNLVATQKARAESEHALAVLLGRSPADFSLPAQELTDAAPPIVPAGLPSTLLERRPDIASAERQVEARNAEIGAAMGTFFPDISLTAASGLNSAALRDLFSSSSRAWSLMPGLTQPIFNGGLNLAQLKQAKAAYRESVALYRQQILTAFQQVEDALSDLHLLAQQFSVQKQAVAAASATLHLAQLRYRTGVDTYLNVADAEVSDLQTRLSLIEIQRQRYVASANLITALGGGWQASGKP